MCDLTLDLFMFARERQLEILVVLIQREISYHIIESDRDEQQQNIGCYTLLVVGR